MAFRILSLDGGGSWALIQVQALINLYGAAAKGRDVLADFDLVAANSGGSIVVGGLVENLTLGELNSYFTDEAKRRSIFSPTKYWGDRVLHDLTGMGPKYSSEAKLPALERLLPITGDRPLSGLMSGVGRSKNNVHLLIVSFDYDRNRAKFFRSAPAGTVGGASGFGAPATVTLAEAIHASTNAPVNYFDEPAQFPGDPSRYWDGGITGCNNPVLAAVTEAVVLGQNPTNLAVLSIGTATVQLPLASTGQKGGPFEQSRMDQSLVADLKKLATSILDDPPDAATFISHTLTGGDLNVPPPAVSRIVRMNPQISPIRTDAGGWSAPGGMTRAQFKYLCGIDMDAIDPNEIAAIVEYAGLWLRDEAPNQAIRIDYQTLKPEIGYEKFSDARKAWMSIR